MKSQKTPLFVAVENRTLTVYASGHKLLGTFDFSSVGAKKLGAFFKKHKIYEVMCSSTCDFPEDGDAAYVDVHRFIQDAWDIAKMPQKK